MNYFKNLHKNYQDTVSCPLFELVTVLFHLHFTFDIVENLKKISNKFRKLIAEKDTVPWITTGSRVRLKTFQIH